jgi:hypothetical protein
MRARYRGQGWTLGSTYRTVRANSRQVDGENARVGPLAFFVTDSVAVRDSIALAVDSWK